MCNFRILAKTVIDITFPCSAPRLFVPSKPTPPPTNDTKPIRLTRNRLPTVTNSTSNTNTTPSKEEQQQQVDNYFSIEEKHLLIYFLDICGYVYWLNISCQFPIHSTTST